MQPVQNYSNSTLANAERIRPRRYGETVHDLRESRSRFARLSRQAREDEEKFSTSGSADADEAAGGIFAALANAKIWTSRVSMHVRPDTKAILFKQLDVLHDVDEWCDGDAPLNLSSYQSLVRAIIYHKIGRHPSLSLMPNGNLAALWTDQSDKLTVEFLPNNRIHWVASNRTEDGQEKAAGTCPLERLRNVLEPYGVARWFDAA